MNPGLKYEKDFARKIGGKIVPGSGNKWYAKLDVRSSSIIWSCKYTSKVSFSLTKDILYEAWRAAIGPGGSGTIPALAINIESADEEVVVLRLSDFLSLLQDERKLFEPTGKSKKMLQSAVPKFRRGHGEVKES